MKTPSATTLSVMIFLWVGCGGDPKLDDKPKENPSSTLPSQLTLRLEPQPTPHSYHVTLDWKPISGLGDLRIERAKETVVETLAVVSEATSTYTDKNALSGTSYEYSVMATDGGHKLSHRIEIPRDLVIDSVIRADRIQGYSRLFLGRKSVLRSEGRDLKISVEEIHSDDGLIESFSQGATAASGTAGRNGGEITVFAKRGFGQIRITARGETGGCGRPGFPGRPGRAGNAGKAGELVLKNEPRDEFFRKLLHTHVARLESKYDALYAAWKEVYECAAPPQDGEKGGDGESGGHGMNGARGGDSGRIFVRIDNAGLKIVPLSQPGEGGVGGKAGDGGPGGPGGAAGLRDRHHLCPEAKDGPRGQKGASGEPGQTGAQGQQEPLCLIIGPVEFGDCAELRANHSG